MASNDRRLLAYTESGAGPPVVLVHGLARNVAYWLRVAPLLEAVRAIALDLRGHGLSEHCESYRYADHADEVVSAKLLRGESVATEERDGKRLTIRAVRSAELLWLQRRSSTNARGNREGRPVGLPSCV